MTIDLPWVGGCPSSGWWVTFQGIVGDFDDHEISSVRNFRPLGALEASNSLTGIGREGRREGGTFCVLSRVASQLKRY